MCTFYLSLQGCEELQNIVALVKIVLNKLLEGSDTTEAAHQVGPQPAPEPLVSEVSDWPQAKAYPKTALTSDWDSFSF